MPLSVGAVRPAVPAQQVGSSRVSVLAVVMMLRFFLSTNLSCCSMKVPGPASVVTDALDDGQQFPLSQAVKCCHFVFVFYVHLKSFSGFFYRCMLFCTFMQTRLSLFL